MHRHRWEEQRRKFNPPGFRAAEIRVSEEFLREFTFGVTVVELKCITCGDIKAVRYTGNSGKG